MKIIKSKWVLVFIVATMLLFVSAFVISQANISLLPHTNNMLLIQDGDLDLLPQRLQRLSWGSVIAGTVMSLIIMFILNLLGIAIGLTQVNPEYDHDSTDATGIATGSLAWIAVSNLIALFVGGWVAAYFAGIPETWDGFLHGLMVWAVSGIITVLFVMSGLGRLISGMASLLSSGISLTGALASTAGQITGGALHTVGSAASTAGNLGAQSLSVLAKGVQNSAQSMGSGLSALTDSAIENMPDVQDALHYQDLSYQEIKHSIANLISQAGKDPKQLKGEVNQTVDELDNVAKYAIRHPETAPDMLEIALRRVLRRGEAGANEVDREALRSFITDNTALSEEEATKKIQQLEEQFNKVKQQTKQAREIAKQRAEEFRQEAEEKAKEIYEKAYAQVEEMQHEAESRLKEVADEAEAQARHTAQQASNTFSKLAAGIAISMLIGAAAAGLGGFLGVPKSLPDVPVSEASNFSPDYNYF